MFCCQGKLAGSTGASLAGRGMSFGAVLLIAASTIVSAESVGGVSVWIAAANGREAALVLRKLRRLSMRSIMDDHRPPYEPETMSRSKDGLPPEGRTCSRVRQPFLRILCYGEHC